jgi:hypothetical protein
MNLSDSELLSFASALVIFYIFIAVLILVVLKPLNEDSKLLNEKSAAATNSNELVNDCDQKIKCPKDAKKRELVWDSLALVPLYSGLLIVTSFLLGSKRASSAPTLAIILISFVVIAAASDWIENYLSYFAINNGTEESRFAGLATCFKWLALFAATGTASFIFLRFNINIWIIAGVLLLLASVVGMGTIVFSGFDSSRIENSKAVIGAFGFQLLILFFVGFLLLFKSNRTNFLDGY